MRLKIKGMGQEFFHDGKSESISIGRSSDNDFVVPMEDFSRKHCLVTRKGDYFFITDLGSKNGIIIDGVRLTANKTYPIYVKNCIILANHFEMILPGGSFTGKNDAGGEISIQLEDRKRSY